MGQTPVNRRPKNSSNSTGGQFAPITNGKTPPMTVPDIPYTTNPYMPAVDTDTTRLVWDVYNQQRIAREHHDIVSKSTSEAVTAFLNDYTDFIGLNPMTDIEADYLKDACDSSAPSFTDPNLVQKALYWAQRDPDFGARMKAVYFDARTGGLLPDVGEPSNYTGNTLGMLYSMHRAVRENPEWQPTYDLACAVQQYINMRTRAAHGYTYVNDGGYPNLHTEALTRNVPWATHKELADDGQRMYGAICEGFYGPNGTSHLT